MGSQCEDAKIALLELNVERVQWKAALRSVSEKLENAVMRGKFLRDEYPRLESFVSFWERVKFFLAQFELHVDRSDIEQICRDADASWYAWKFADVDLQEVVEATDHAATTIRQALRAGHLAREERFQEAKRLQLVLFGQGRRLRDGDDIIILDGGMGRELFSVGAPFRQPEWSALSLMEGPHFVSEVHDSFVAAGCDVITTNSYALVPFHLGADVFALRGAALAALAGELARNAAVGIVKVAGSLPPMASYSHSFDSLEVAEVSGVLVMSLEKYVDLWLIETQSTLEEARGIYEQTRNKPVWISFTVDDGDGTRLRGGMSVEEAAKQAASWPRVEAILFNCSGRGAILDALKASQSLRGVVRLGVYANAFKPRCKHSPEANVSVLPILAVQPLEYCEWSKECAMLGASILGGCCGISPAHISRVKKEMSSWKMGEMLC